MNGRQAFKIGLQAWTKRRIKSVAQTLDCVTADLGTGNQLELGGAQWLELIQNVRVPEVDAGVCHGIPTQGTEVVHDYVCG